MRYIYLIIFLLVLQFSFAQKPKKNAAYKFTYLYSDALKYKLSENYDEAFSLFQECLKYEPNSSATLYQLSLIKFRKKDYNAALEYIDKAIRIVPDNEWYLLQKAQVASRLDDDKAFVSAYRDLYRYFPDNPEYAYKLAVIDYKQKKYDDALVILNKIEKEQGVVENVSFLKNNIYYQTNRYDLLLAELKKLVAVFPDSVKYIDMLAKYYSSMRQVNKAMETYQDALKKFPGNKRLSLSLAALYGEMKGFNDGYPYLITGIGAEGISLQEQLKTAEIFLNTRDISRENKIKIYETLIQFFPDAQNIQTEFVRYLLHEKLYDTAEQQLSGILKEHPENFDLWNTLFDIYASQNRFEELLKASEQSLEYFPNQSLAYFYSGFASFYLKKYQKAVSYLETGLDYVFDNQNLEKQFYFYLAEAYHALQDTEKSDKYFEKYLSMDMTNAYLMNNYAYYLSQGKRNLDKALNLSQRSIEIEPFNSSFLDTYAWIYYLKGDIKSALFNIEKSYKYGGKDNPVICEHYGYILLENKQIDKAKEMFKRALELKPDNDALREKLQSLE